jgi:hypothetical protein
VSKTTDVAPVGARQAHRAPATLQEEKAHGRIDSHQLVLTRVGSRREQSPEVGIHHILD